MEGIIYVGDKEFRAKANAITPMHYKNQFKSDILKDSFKALGGVDELLALSQSEGNEVGQMEKIIESIDTVLIYQLTWAFIKTADKNTVPFTTWLEDLEYIPVTDLLLQDTFLELLTGNLHRKK